VLGIRHILYALNLGRETLYARGTVSGLTVVVATIGILGAACSARSHSSAPSPTVATRVTGPTARLASSAKAFAGTSHVHTYYLRIRADGHGTAEWPVGFHCGAPETPPGQACDKVVPTTMTMPDGTAGNVDEIIDGGHAQLRLTSVTPATAIGVVEGSTDASALPDGPVTLTITTDDLLVITTPGSSVYGRSPLCGPRAEAMSPDEKKTKGVNCGA